MKPFNKRSQLVLDLVQECFDAMAVFLAFVTFVTRRLSVLVITANKCVHGGRQCSDSFTHPGTLGCENNPLHSGLPVVPAIIRTVGGVIAIVG